MIIAVAAAVFLNSNTEISTISPWVVKVKMTKKTAEVQYNKHLSFIFTIGKNNQTKPAQNSFPRQQFIFHPLTESIKLQSDLTEQLHFPELVQLQNNFQRKVQPKKAISETSNCSKAERHKERLTNNSKGNVCGQ